MNSTEETQRATKGGSVSESHAQKKEGPPPVCPQCLMRSSIDCTEAGCPQQETKGPEPLTLQESLIVRMAAWMNDNDECMSKEEMAVLQVSIFQEARAIREKKEAAAA